MSYVPKKCKSVILLLSMHRSKEIDELTKKPAIILDYNNTKGGVDLMDQLIGRTTCRRKVNRWPMACFFNLIDISALNAFIIYTYNYPDWNESKAKYRR